MKSTTNHYVSFEQLSPGQDCELKNCGREAVVRMHSSLKYEEAILCGIHAAFVFGLSLERLTRRRSGASKT
jgi:hypothetical protein